MAFKATKKFMIQVTLLAIIVTALLRIILGGSEDNPIDVAQSAVDELNAKTEEQEALAAELLGSGSSSGGSRKGGGSGSSLSVTKAEFQKNNTKNSCWVLIEGEVFDITPLLSDAVLDVDLVGTFCGTFGFEAGFLAMNPEMKIALKTSATKKGRLR